jgi:hypothetical protein
MSKYRISRLPVCFMKEWSGMTSSGQTLPGFVVIG